MEFVVPRRMGGNAMDIDGDTAYDEDATVVVCSGEVVEQVDIKKYEKRTKPRHILTFYFIPFAYRLYIPRILRKRLSIIIYLSQPLRLLLDLPLVLLK